MYLASDSATTLASISKGAPMFKLTFFKGTPETMGFRLAALLMGARSLKFFLTVKGVTKAWKRLVSLKSKEFVVMGYYGVKKGINSSPELIQLKKIANLADIVETQMINPSAPYFQSALLF